MTPPRARAGGQATSHKGAGARKHADRRIDLELRLSDEPDAVPLARRFAADTLGGVADPAVLSAAELVVSELVTNALLHGGRPVVLRLRPHDSGVRVEVQDPSRSAPVRVRSEGDAGAMTGRGLALVDAVSRRWGVTPVEGGKVVWSELGTTPRRAADEPAAAAGAPAPGWDEAAADRGRRYPVRLHDVPTDLLAAAKGHVDNLVREFALAAGGASSGHSAAVPPRLVQLIDTVTRRFADARQAIKRQALAAVERGEDRTTLTLTLPAGDADEAAAYLAALDEVDTYARAARLLTLETPPQHKLFRRWYVQAVIAQLKAAEAGLPAPAVPTLEQRLLDELGEVAAAKRMSDRAARLQTVTAALAGTTTVEEVAEVVVSEGVSVLGAVGGGLLLVGDDDRLTVPAAVGYGSTLLERLRSEPKDAELPAAVAMRTGETVWLESKQVRDERFPELTWMEPETVSLCAVPLLGARRALGALRFSFGSSRLFGDDERRFVQALAGQTTQALERSLLYEAERRARTAAESLAARLARLQRVTAELTAVTSVEEVAEVVVDHAAEAVGAIVSSLCLLEGDDVRIVAMRGGLPGARERWSTFPLAADLPASEAIRANRPVVVPDRAELERRYPALSGFVAGERALVCLPLSVGQRRLGAVSLSFSLDRNMTDPDELSFLTSLADACSQAIDRSLALQAAGEAAAKLEFLADASAELASSLDYRSTLANVARLVVPRLADWCAVHVVHDGEYEPVAVAHTDPDKVAYAREVQRRHPVDPDAPTGVANVVRTGRSELVPELTEEMIEAAEVDDEQRQVARELITTLGLRSVITVPMTGPAGTIGAIQMVQAESGRRYGPDDLDFAEEIARRAALAVHNAWEYRRQSTRLAAITRVADAAQRAILAPVPARVGPLALAAAYLSAAQEALVGGDFYETVARPGAVRLLIGDVRGKGLDAVRLATVVLGQFRAAAVECDSLAAVAEQMDGRLRPYLEDEDFVTALLAEVRDDGSCQIVSCGHPPALHVRGGTISEIICTISVPLGLGALPPPVTVQLARGDRLLLYTDGLIEVRDEHGRFADRDQLVAPLATEPLTTALDRVLDGLAAVAAGELGDDLALLVAEYRPR